MKKSRKNIEEVMERRQIREIISKNNYQLLFSKMHTIELDKCEFSKRKFSSSDITLTEDKLYTVQ